jgi:hypothetical protein
MLTITYNALTGLPPNDPPGQGLVFDPWVVTGGSPIPDQTATCGQSISFVWPKGTANGVATMPSCECRPACAPGLRILLLAAKHGPNVLFCTPNRIKCILWISVMAAAGPNCRQTPKPAACYHKQDGRVHQITKCRTLHETICSTVCLLTGHALHPAATQLHDRCSQAGSTNEP